MSYEAAQNNESLQPPTHGGNRTNGSSPLEKDFSNGYDLHHNMDEGEALKRIQTAGSISISPELFEKLYLSPQNKVSGDLRKTFGNPTPLCLVGFLLSLTPLSCDLMGWRGAGGSGAASTGAYFFFGGLLMILGAIGEWILGNTFPFVVFGSFGAFWLTFGATLQPFYNAYGAYSPDPSIPGEGLATTGFNASFAFFLLFMGLLCFIYFICALRTNVVFVLIFILLVPSFGCLAGAYWHLAMDPKSTIVTPLLIAAGAMTFVIDMLGWYLFFGILLASLDFPFSLPVGDLSRMIKGGSEKARDKGEHSA
ncbi:hypothetical protein LTR95_011203 [Oleoguttula sp. CCFEE 5521]|uniref:Protein alcS n=1 Tax=Cryoendolithus antarcticus TaxID=1507870 RepID=A0A1V8STI0_9PEZI|nr:hypothetical protein B0A48_12034 [Cryoendolithus antarcticus]